MWSPSEEKKYFAIIRELDLKRSEEWKVVVFLKTALLK